MSHSIRQEISPLLQLMLPILVTQFSQSGLGLIDTVMAGHLSTADLAAVAIGVGMWLPVMILFSGIMMAISPLVAQAKGANQTHNIRTITHQGLWLALVVGLIGTVLLFSLSYAIPLLQLPTEVERKAILFTQAISFGIPAITLFGTLRAYSEALGYARPVMMFSLLGLPLLIPLNLIFMHGFGAIPALGGAGCGFASAILQWILVVILATYLIHNKKYRSTRLLTQWETPSWQQIKPILYLGLPIGLALFFEVGIFCLAALILSPLGKIAVAAHQVTLSVTTQIFMIPAALGIALTIRIGHYFGERNWPALKQVQILGFSIATLLACTTMLAVALVRHDLAALYTKDPLVIQLATQLFVLAIAYQLIDAWQITAAGCLRGLQDTTSPMWITFIAYWLIAFPLGVLLSRYYGYGVAGFWFSLIIGLTVACVLLIIQLYRNNLRLATLLQSASSR